MRKFLVSAVLVASTIAVAAPATAQWSQPYPQGNAYGYQGNYGQVRRLDARIDQLQRRIRALDVRNVIGHREATRLAYQARNIEQRLQMFANNGVDRGERSDIENRVARLEQRIQQAVSDERYGQGGNGDRNPYGFDRDRDGRDDRYEDDRGRDSDRRRDRDRDDDD